MELHNSIHEQRVPIESPEKGNGNPFSQSLDTELVAVIQKLESLYREGRRTFVLITHRDPDADAIAGCFGFDRLIRGILPDDVTVRWMHDGHLCAPLREASGRDTESVSNLKTLIQSSPEGAVAIILVDQPGLHSCAVLPPAIRLDEVFVNREADIILDHHGDPRHQDGAICAPECGCTAALVYRLLQHAENHERYRSVPFTEKERAHFALLVNIGARTDAGQSVSGELPRDVSPYVLWAVANTEGFFSAQHARPFDVLEDRHARLVETAQREAQVYEGIEIKGVVARLIVAYAGVVESSHCVGACASKLFEIERARAHREPTAIPVAVVVCGLIRPEEQSDESVVHAGERVQVSVRSEAPVDAEHIAATISSVGGGRTGAAAAQLAVPEQFDCVPDEVYASRLLELLEAKLTLPHSGTWNVDARP